MGEDALIGRQFANFRVERLIGRGGMAQVYYGRDIILQRPVAIKVIDHRYRGQTTYAERFVREARTVATWRHENIMQVFYAGEDNGLYYFVMEYIDGMDLGRLLGHYGTDHQLMPQADVLRITRAVASALDYAHKRGVIHRDIKPSNVMVATDERIVLADFGLAMDVQQGTLGETFGTPRYIAPEQARRSSEAVPQSDLYSLGIVVYEMLTGNVPFDDPSPASLALQHITLPPPSPRNFNPALSDETEQVLLKALSKSPAERYQSGSDLIRALEASFQGLNDQPYAAVPVVDRVVNFSARQPTPAQRPEPFEPTVENPTPTSLQKTTGRRSIRGFAAAAVVVLLVAAGFIMYTLLGDKDKNEKPQENELVAMVTEEATQTLIPTQPLPTDTATPTPTETVLVIVDIATDLPPAPTQTPIDTPTATPEPIFPTIQAAEPTVLYPDGKHVTLYYNANSLYLYNASGNRLALDSFALERLHGTGDASNRFEGSRWAQFYPYVQSQACVSVQIGNSSPLLNPNECQANNAEVWISRGFSPDFWTPQNDSTQFRVLWNNAEVARCEITDGVCEIFVP